MLSEIGTDKVYLACGATDLRKSIDGLAVLVKESFNLDPFSSALFVFCNRQRNKLKILEWDRNGFWLYYRRLERGKFQWPERTSGAASWTRASPERAGWRPSSFGVTTAVNRHMPYWDNLYWSYSPF